MLAWTAVDWERYISKGMNVAARVEFGRSRSTPVQVRWNGQAPHVRFHHMFAETPEPIREATLAWLRNGRRARRACRELDAWIQLQLQALPPVSPRRVRQVPEGTAYDLSLLAAELCNDTFAGEFDGEPEFPGLTWGRRVKSRSRHTLQLGSYSPERHLVRVHPVLDQEAVPAWFVRYVVFHELLHALIPAKKDGSRRWRHHCPEFRQRESEYADYGRALLWEKQTLPALIRSARSGKQLPVRKKHAGGRVLDKLQGFLFPA